MSHVHVSQVFHVFMSKEPLQYIITWLHRFTLSAFSRHIKYKSGVFLRDEENGTKLLCDKMSQAPWNCFQIRTNPISIPMQMSLWLFRYLASISLHIRERKKGLSQSENVCPGKKLRVYLLQCLEANIANSVWGLSSPRNAILFQPFFLICSAVLLLLLPSSSNSHLQKQPAGVT